MPDHAAFLRGMGVGNRRPGKAELCECFEKLGLTDVASFRASGNVVFSGKAKAADVEASLAEGLGYDVVVFLRTAAQVHAIAGREPFPGAEGKLQVVLLARKPPAKAVRELQAQAGDGDRLAFDDRELYWLPEGGTMDSPLGMDAWKVLGPNTMRTLGTMQEMARKYFS